MNPIAKPKAPRHKSAMQRFALGMSVILAVITVVGAAQPRVEFPIAKITGTVTKPTIVRSPLTVEKRDVTGTFTAYCLGNSIICNTVWPDAETLVSYEPDGFHATNDFPVRFWKSGKGKWGPTTNVYRLDGYDTFLAPPWTLMWLARLADQRPDATTWTLQAREGRLETWMLDYQGDADLRTAWEGASTKYRLAVLDGQVTRLEIMYDAGSTSRTQCGWEFSDLDTTHGIPRSFKPVTEWDHAASIATVEPLPPGSNHASILKGLLTGKQRKYFNNGYGPYQEGRFFAATLEDFSGTSVPLSDFRGKGLLLHVWASWSPPEPAIDRELLSIHSSSVDKPWFHMFGICLDADAGAAKRAAKARGYLWPQLLAGSHKLSLVRAFITNTIPAVLLVSPKGNFTAWDEGDGAYSWNDYISRNGDRDPITKVRFDLSEMTKKRIERWKQELDEGGENIAQFHPVARQILRDAGAAETYRLFRDSADKVMLTTQPLEKQFLGNYILYRGKDQSRPFVEKLAGILLDEASYDRLVLYHHPEDESYTPVIKGPGGRPRLNLGFLRAGYRLRHNDDVLDVTVDSLGEVHWKLNPRPTTKHNHFAYPSLTREAMHRFLTHAAEALPQTAETSGIMERQFRR